MKRKKRDLTDKERKILNFIIEEKKKGITPSIREIGKHFGLNSTATVFFHLRNLEKKGYIKRGRGARSIVVIKSKRVNSFPLVGNVRAGKPNLPVEEVEDYLNLPFDREIHPGAFLLKVKGESMKGAGILDGDIIVVDPDMEVKDNDICLALIGNDEVTVKRFKIKNGKRFLIPEHPEYSPIEVKKGIKIFGKVIGVWRRY